MYSQTQFATMTGDVRISLRILLQAENLKVHKRLTERVGMLEYAAIMLQQCADINTC